MHASIQHQMPSFCKNYKAIICRIPSAADLVYIFFLIDNPCSGMVQ